MKLVHNLTSRVGRNQSYFCHIAWALSRLMDEPSMKRKWDTILLQGLSHITEISRPWREVCRENASHGRKQLFVPQDWITSTLLIDRENDSYSCSSSVHVIPGVLLMLKWTFQFQESHFVFIRLTIDYEKKTLTHMRSMTFTVPLLLFIHFWFIQRHFQLDFIASNGGIIRK